MTNRVDYIKSSIEGMEKTIADLQTACEHKFSITKSFDEPKISIVNSVYLGIEGNNRPKGSDFTITCSKCSLVKNLSYCFSCPRCFEDLKVEDLVNWRSDYKEDRYRRFGYYGVRMSTCPNRDFSIANDEFDQ